MALATEPTSPRRTQAAAAQLDDLTPLSAASTAEARDILSFGISPVQGGELR